MYKNQKGFAHHILLPLIVLAVIVFIGFVVLTHHNPSNTSNTASSAKNSNQNNPATQWASPAVYAQLPDCKGNELLTRMPVADGISYDMVPLGLVNGTGGHTYPSDHTYLNFEGHYGNYDVLSPGNIYVTKIRRISREVNGVSSSDASVFFMPCKQVAFYFNHIQLTDALDKAIPSSNDPKTNDCAFAGGQNGKQNTTNNTVNSDCTQLATTVVKFSAGEKMGTATVTQNQIGWDFGAVDARVANLQLINPGTEGDTTVTQGLTYLKSVCPINYLPASVQQTVFAKPGFANRPTATKCGEIAQDKTGTIQGNWYLGAHVDYVADWQKELGVIHYNVDPSVAELSIGGNLGPGGELVFSPATSGTINPEPSVTKVGQLYCFATNVPSNQRPSDPAYNVGHKVLLQLTSNTTMKAEYQTGDCSGHDSFNQPLTYYR